MSKIADDVVGTVEFRRFFEKIPRTEPRRKELVSAFKILKENCLSGNKIPHKLWPQVYIKKYGIKNLWRFEMKQGCRMTYTILEEKGALIVCIIEVFSHNDYEKKFSY